MKRSEANEILKARVAFSREYQCVSTVRRDESGEICTHDDGNCACDAEEFFSHAGCDICPDRLAATVTEVRYLAAKDIEKRIFDSVYEGQLCSGCLCSQVNGDDSDLDYHVTEEDAPAHVYPVVGMPVTKIMLTDRYAFTVVRVLSDDKIVIRADTAKRFDGSGRAQLHVVATGTEEITVTRRKNGAWVQQGQSMKNGQRFVLGERATYINPEF